MALVTTAGSSTADSYATVTEVDTYLAARSPFNTSDEYTSWLELTEAQKETRMKIATMMIDSMRFRGLKATLEQSLAFPRVFPGDDLYPKKAKQTTWVVTRIRRWEEQDDDSREARAETWSDLSDLADSLDVSLPTVPDEIKNAQAEVAFQVVHYHLLSLDPMEEGATNVNKLAVGPLSVAFAKAQTEQAAYSVFRASAMDATSIIYFMLKKYLAGGIRGALI